MNAITGRFSRLYRGSWPQGEMGWTVDLLIVIQNLVSDQVHRITGWRISGILSNPKKRLTKPPPDRLSPLIIATSHTPPWLASGWGCRDRRLSRAGEVLIGTRPFDLELVAGGFLLSHAIEHPDTPGKVLHR
jgi:hypothetical protein